MINPFNFTQRKMGFMNFFKGELYHIYNRGNNRQKIFFNHDNYVYFLHKVRRFIQPYCDILAWTLMPNHFHFYIHANQKTIASKIIGGTKRNILGEGIRNMLSSYTQAINKQRLTTGSLFAQNTKSKLISNIGNQYDQICFHYIHQNPVKSKLVNRMEDWEFSSFRDYCGLRNGNLVNKQMGIEILNLNMATFMEDSYQNIPTADIENLFLK